MRPVAREQSDLLTRCQIHKQIDRQVIARIVAHPPGKLGQTRQESRRTHRRMNRAIATPDHVPSPLRAELDGASRGGLKFREAIAGTYASCTKSSAESPTGIVER